MNEQIKTLMGQTLDEKFAGTWSTMDMQDLAKFAEKFAELIVRECANHCDLLLDHKISSEWSRGTHDCSRAIKQHFGVEDRAVPILSADEQALFAGIASSKLFTIEGAKKQFGVEE